MAYRDFSRYLVACSTCANQTATKYSREHNGQCKECATGISKCVTGISTGTLCPDCKEHKLTTYQKKHRYHCDSCTRNADPEDYRQEVMGYHNMESEY